MGTRQSRKAGTGQLGCPKWARKCHPPTNHSIVHPETVSCHSSERLAGRARMPRQPQPSGHGGDIPVGIASPQSWHLPLWELRGSCLLARRIHVAHHKVLCDLLHVFIVEESVEAKLVCQRAGRDQRPNAPELGPGRLGEHGERLPALPLPFNQEMTCHQSPPIPFPPGSSSAQQRPQPLLARAASLLVLGGTGMNRHSQGDEQFGVSFVCLEG